jgi:hypothetical protein
MLQCGLLDRGKCCYRSYWRRFSCWWDDSWIMSCCCVLRVQPLRIWIRQNKLLGSEALQLTSQIIQILVRSQNSAAVFYSEPQNLLHEIMCTRPSACRLFPPICLSSWLKGEHMAFQQFILSYESLRCVDFVLFSQSCISCQFSCSKILKSWAVGDASVIICQIVHPSHLLLNKSIFREWNKIIKSNSCKFGKDKQFSGFGWHRKFQCVMRFATALLYRKLCKSAIALYLIVIKRECVTKVLINQIIRTRTRHFVMRTTLHVTM